MNANLIPMNRVTGLGNLPELVEKMESARALYSLFEQEQVPISVLENLDNLMPVFTTVQLFEKASRIVGDRLFGLRVGDYLTPKSYGPWLEYSGFAPTLGEAISRANKTVHLQQTTARLWLEPRGEYLVWKYATPAIPIIGKQYSEHNVPPMIRFASAYLGAHWVPKWVELNYGRDGDAAVLETHLGTRILYDKRDVGIALHRHDLAQKRRAPLPGGAQHQITLFDVLSSQARLHRRDSLSAIVSIASLRLRDGATDLEGLAALTGLSTRTLQRVLQAQGLSYRRLVERLRVLRAESLLQETDQSITQIAIGLGYAEPTNFTRAFKRITGLTPQEFRRTRAPGVLQTAI